MGETYHLTVNSFQVREIQMMLPTDYLNINPEVTSQMRGILVDWLIQVQVSDILTADKGLASLFFVPLYRAHKVITKGSTADCGLFVLCSLHQRPHKVS